MVHVRYHFVTTFGCFWYDKKTVAILFVIISIELVCEGRDCVYTIHSGQLQYRVYGTLLLVFVVGRLVCSQVPLQIPLKLTISFVYILNLDLLQHRIYGTL